jgi:two-component system response regulator TrcR
VISTLFSVSIGTEKILLELGGDYNLFHSRTLNVYITKLRNYLKEDPGIRILNIRGIGYKLIIRNAV